jgi:Kelch motif/Galactose oxidase, central domain
VSTTTAGSPGDWSAPRFQISAIVAASLSESIRAIGTSHKGPSVRKRVASPVRWSPMMHSRAKVGRAALIAGALSRRTVFFFALAFVESHAFGSNGWTTVGSTETMHMFHTTTLLQSGTVLIAGGFDYGPGGSIADAELFDPVRGTWTATASLLTARSGHTATLLLNGKVLVTGGCGVECALASAELYDPVSGAWTVTGSMTTTRVDHTATLLPSGKVLVAGGYLNDATAELYDPTTGKWSATGSMLTGRSYHTATLLPSGKVLVTGGDAQPQTLDAGYASASAELYDPTTGTWSATGSMSMERSWHSATLLPNGNVLVAENANTAAGLSGSSSTELYDPTSGTWSTTGSMKTARGVAAAGLLPSGKVLIAGGCDGSGMPIASAELYDPSTGMWSSTASMPTWVYYNTMAVLPTGKALVAGGFFIGNAGQLGTPSEAYKEPGLVVIDPGNVTLETKGTLTFSASGGSGTGYAWSFVKNASGGTITASGGYTAGGTGGVTDIVVVTDSFGGSATATATVKASSISTGTAASNSGGCNSAGGDVFPFLALAALPLLRARRFITSQPRRRA